MVTGVGCIEAADQFSYVIGPMSILRRVDVVWSVRVTSWSLLVVAAPSSFEVFEMGSMVLANGELYIVVGSEELL